MNSAHIIETLGYIAFIAIACLFLYRTRPKHHDNRTVSATSAQRDFDWRQKVDANIGTDSEEFISLGARGAIAKRRMLAECRNRAQQSFLKVENRQLVTVTSRKGLYEPRRKVIELKPLASFAKRAEPQVTVRRLLTLAK